MRIDDFWAIVREELLKLLPAELRKAARLRIRSVWFQVHFHTPRVHYEVWLARKIERIELGLHFEGPREFSYAWAALIAEHMPEIQASLGRQYELEEWTASWARLHETLPYDPLTEALAGEVAARLARLISTCQPIAERLRDQVPASLAAEPPRPTATRGRFQRRRRAQT